MKCVLPILILSSAVLVSCREPLLSWQPSKHGDPSHPIDYPVPHFGTDQDIMDTMKVMQSDETMYEKKMKLKQMRTEINDCVAELNVVRKMRMDQEKEEVKRTLNQNEQDLRDEETENVDVAMIKMDELQVEFKKDIEWLKMEKARHIQDGKDLEYSRMVEEGEQLTAKQQQEKRAGLAKTMRKIGQREQAAVKGKMEGSEATRKATAEAKIIARKTLKGIPSYNGMEDYRFHQHLAATMTQVAKREAPHMLSKLEHTRGRITEAIQELEYQLKDVPDNKRQRRYLETEVGRMKEKLENKDKQIGRIKGNYGYYDLMGYTYYLMGTAPQGMVMGDAERRIEALATNEAGRHWLMENAEAIAYGAVQVPDLAELASDRIPSDRSADREDEVPYMRKGVDPKFIRNRRRSLKIMLAKKKDE